MSYYYLIVKNSNLLPTDAEMHLDDCGFKAITPGLFSYKNVDIIDIILSFEKYVKLCTQQNNLIVYNDYTIIRVEEKISLDLLITKK